MISQTMSSANQWYYLAGSDHKGPFDDAAIIQLFHAGVIHPDTPVAKHGDTDWRSAAVALSGLQTSGPLPHPQVANPNPRGLAGRPDSDDRSLLLWAGIPLLAFFLSGMVFWKGLCDWRFPDGGSGDQPRYMSVSGLCEMLAPSAPFNPTRELIASLGTLLIMILLVLLLNHLSLTRTLRKANARKPLIKTLLLPPLIWGVILIAGLSTVLFVTTPRTYVLLTILKCYQVERGANLTTFTVMLAAIFAASLAAFWKSRKSIKLARQQRAVPSRSSMLGSGCSLATILLILYSFVMAGKIWSACSRAINPDVLTLNCVAQAITDYQQQSGGNLAAEWKEAALLDGGDVVEFVGGSLFQTLDLVARLKKLPNGDWRARKSVFEGHVVDAWNKHPIYLLLDGNNDGFLDFPGRRIPGAAAIWTVGWNGKSDDGAGDDLMLIVPTPGSSR